MGKKFEHLRHIVEKEYEKKGFSHERAKKIGYATAGKIYREKKK